MNDIKDLFRSHPIIAFSMLGVVVATSSAVALRYYRSFQIARFPIKKNEKVSKIITETSKTSTSTNTEHAKEVPKPPSPPPIEKSDDAEEQRRIRINKIIELRRVTQNRSDKDLERYRNGYPGLVDVHGEDNYLFYTGQIQSVPDGDYIDNILAKWKGDYPLLETHHGYIQWLFPIRERGMNSESQPLTLVEREKMQNDPKCIERLLRAYSLMMDFYGCKVGTNGDVSRADNWKERYENTDKFTHNNLRITRILKCLGEFGFEDWKEKFLSHFVNEMWIKDQLPRCKESCRNYWIGTLKDNTKRNELRKIVEEQELKEIEKMD